MKIALLFVAIYLLAVVYQGNTQTLITELMTEKSFVSWAIAIGILLGLDSIDSIKPIIAPFIGIVLIALLLNAYSNSNVQNEIQQFQQTFGSISGGVLPSVPTTPAVPSVPNVP